MIEKKQEFQWYNFDRIASYNAMMNIIMTARGNGKTFGLKLRAIKKFIKTGGLEGNPKAEQFMYVRRYKSELKKTAKTFFDDIIRSGLFPDLKFEVKGMEMFINGKLFGFFIPLSISQSFKSIAFPNVTVICFDEFLVDKGYIKFLNNEIDVVFDLLETVQRVREDVRMYLLANNVSTYNPYFITFGIKIKEGERFYIAQNGEVVVDYYFDEQFAEFKRNSKFGRLIEGTKYADYSIGNKSLRDSDTFIELVNKKYCHPLLVLSYNGTKVQMYIAPKLNLTYVDTNIVPNCQTFTIDSDSHDSSTILYNKLIKTTVFIQLQKSFSLGTMRFENQLAKQTIYESFKRLGIK